MNYNFNSLCRSSDVLYATVKAVNCKYFVVKFFLSEFSTLQINEYVSYIITRPCNNLPHFLTVFFHRWERDEF